MTAQRPLTFALVLAGHLLLAWVLLSITSGWPQLAGRSWLQPGQGLLSVVLHPAQQVTAAALATPEAWRAAPRPQQATVRPPRAKEAGAMPPVASALADAAPGQHSETAAASPADPGRTSAESAPAPEPQRVVASAAAAAPTGPAPGVSARADRRLCPPTPHPAALRERGIEGAVLLRVKVDVQGRAADVHVLAGSGWRLFDEAALQQVRACRFVPAVQDGQAIDSWVEFPVRFALTG